jgi:hypothetical protein
MSYNDDVDAQVRPLFEGRVDALFKKLEEKGKIFSTDIFENQMKRKHVFFMNVNCAVN